MADGNEIPNITGDKTHINDEDSDCESRLQPILLDLGDDISHLADSNRLGNHSAGVSNTNETTRREDNPFSFKHFLRSDMNYQNKGARPKVYCEGRPVASVSDLDFSATQDTKQTRLITEYPSALPDFVQDHLLIEQCYLGNATNSNYNNLDINLPDFTPSRESVNVNRVNIESSHIINRCDKDITIPLDLPLRPSTGFPLDLPISNQQNDSRNCIINEVGVSKSLPDFLADGAAHTQALDGLPAESPEQECQRLRREVEILRRQLNEQSHRADSLLRELEIARNKEHDYTQHLAKALEQVETNLEKSNMRTASAENTILKLKQEIKSLVTQLNSLKSENSNLRGDEGAAGGAHNYFSPNELHSQRLAQELKAAASTAEHSLRQLLTGVDNLRIMAASLENIHRIEEKRDSFLDLDEDSGPAL